MEGGELAYVEWKAELIDAEPNTKKAVILVFIKLAHEAESKTDEEFKTEIQEMLKEGLNKMPWVAVEDVIVVRE